MQGEIHKKGSYIRRGVTHGKKGHIDGRYNTEEGI